MQRLRRTRMLTAVAVPAALLTAAALHLDGAPQLLLWAAPALLLTLPLLFGRFIGEQAIAGWRERRRRVGRLPWPSLRAGRTVVRTGPSGGSLIARALAERGPPVVAGCA